MMFFYVPGKDSWSGSFYLKMLQSLLLLVLGSPLCVVAQSAADYYVGSLPGQPEGPLLKMHAG